MGVDHAAVSVAAGVVRGGYRPNAVRTRRRTSTSALTALGRGRPSARGRDDRTPRPGENHGFSTNRGNYFLFINNQILVINSQFLVINNQILVINSQILVINSQILVEELQILVNDNQILVDDIQLVANVPERLNATRQPDLDDSLTAGCFRDDRWVIRRWRR